MRIFFFELSSTCGQCCLQDWESGVFILRRKKNQLQQYNLRFRLKNMFKFVRIDFQLTLFMSFFSCFVNLDSFFVCRSFYCVHRHLLCQRLFILTFPFLQHKQFWNLSPGDSVAGWVPGHTHPFFQRLSSHKTAFFVLFSSQSSVTFFSSVYLHTIHMECSGYSF